MEPMSTKPANKLRSSQSRPETERDSGFSDASSERTSAKRSPRSVVQKMPQSSNCTVPPSSPLAVAGSPYSDMPPVIIMNNVLLKQPGDDPPALKPWGFSPAMEVVQQPQVVFLQPPVSHHAASSSSTTTKETSSSSSSSSRRRRPKKYLPIVKSYPKIAPYPGHGSGSSGRGTASSSSSSSSSLSSSSCSRSSRSEGGSVLSSSHRERCHGAEQRTSLAGDPCIFGGAASSVSPLLPRPHPLPSSPVDGQSEPVPLSPPGSSGDGHCNRGDCGDGDSEHKRKRFRNTYDVLSRSGLLGIALRTKELLRQNRRTQAELERLGEHAAVFLHALHSGDWSLCLQLQASLQDERPAEREARAQSSSSSSSSSLSSSG